MRLCFKTLLIGLFLISTELFAQQVSEINPELLNRPWTAKWISYSDNSNQEYGVYLFRKEIFINTKPDKFIVHVSADNRYKLYINGVYVCNGPARSYLFKWNFESIDISSYLHSGKNIISSVVWNFAEHRPLAQISGQTGFIIQGNSKDENIINSNKSWLIIKDEAYKPVPVSLNQYYAMGSGEEFYCEKHLWDWMDLDLNTTGWKQAQEVETGKPVGCMGEWGVTSLHLLSPREIPLMEEIASEYRNLADKIKNSVYQRCYDSSRGLIADSPEKNTYSQHANILAILTNCFPQSIDRSIIIDTILNDKELAQCTLYFKFYLFEALEKAGKTDYFMASLIPWKQMIDKVLSTFAEEPDPTRSDCHAWSASPVYYFLSLVSGIKPDAPGFKSVRIEPNLKDLNYIDSKFPHKLGTIQVKLQKDKGNHISGEISLPEQLEGVYNFNGVQRHLHGGKNIID